MKCINDKAFNNYPRHLWIIHSIKVVSQLKLTVIERSTGKERCEEWSFLPADCEYYLSRKQNGVMIDENFALLGFDTLGNPNDTPDLIILNLETRDKFWMRKAMIADEAWVFCAFA